MWVKSLLYNNISIKDVWVKYSECTEYEEGCISITW